MSGTDPTSVSLPTTRPAVRWRIVPGILFLFFGGVGLLNSVLIAGMAIYMNLRYGWMVPDPEHPTLSQVAFTPANILKWQLVGWTSVFAIVAGWTILHCRWKSAWLTIGLTIAGIGAVNLLLELTK